MNTVSLNFALDKIFRILFHEDIPVHLKNLVLLVNPDFLDYAELIKSRLEADERFNSEDGLNWNLNPSNSYTHLNSPLSETEFVITDIEATGSVFGQDRMIEIGAVKMKNGKITDTFHRFINPGIRLPFQIMKMTGLRAADLEDKPGIDAVLPEFAKFRGNAVFCAHNADFDLNFICYELNRIGADMFSGIPEICTLRLARKLIPSMHAHGVAALSEHFNYRLQKHHSAIEDAKATANILSKMTELFDPDNSKSCLDLIRFQRKKQGKAKLERQIRRKLNPGGIYRRTSRQSNA